jgi:hypothetical protein
MTVIGTILLATATAVWAPPPADTIVELRRGDRIVLQSISGDLVVVGGSGDELEVRSLDRGEGLAVRRSGNEVRLVHPDDRSRRRRVDATIRVPRWVSLEIAGLELEISLSGVDGDVRVANVSGDIRLEDIGGALDVRSIEGEVHVQNARGGVRASSQSEDVTIRGVAGPVEVHSGDGDIQLTDVASRSVRAETQDGDITYSGTIERGGEYGFFVHDGDALIAIPAASGVTVHVSTFDGEFESEFPIRVERFSAGREFEFVLGEGGARLQIEVFDGEIRLLQRR